MLQSVKDVVIKCHDNQSPFWGKRRYKKIRWIIFTILLVLSCLTCSQARTMNVVATAYCQGTRTFLGTRVHEGVVAVDPRVIPLRSRLYIPGYGCFTAEDTGGLIKGHRIDLYFRSRRKAIKFGRKRLKITVFPRKRK